MPEALRDRVHDVIGGSSAHLADLVGLERLLRRALAGRDVAVRGDDNRRVDAWEVVVRGRVAGHLPRVADPVVVVDQADAVRQLWGQWWRLRQEGVEPLLLHRRLEQSVPGAERAPIRE